MLFYRRSYRPGVSGTERALSGAALVGLGVLVGWVAGRGAAVDPDLFRLDEASLAQDAPAQVIYEREVSVQASHPTGADRVVTVLGERLPGVGFRRDGPVEVYGFDTLYEKINGRETLYKSYGFRKLWWASYTEGDQSVDLEVFRQEDPMKAFGVFSAERSGMQGAVLEPTRTVTPNGVYFVVDAYYVRVLGSSDAYPVRAAVRGAYRMLSRGLVEDPESAPDAAAAPLRFPGEEGEGPGEARGPAGGAPADGHTHTCPPGYDEPCSHPSHLPEPARAPSPGADAAALLAAPETWTPLRNPLVELGADPASLEFHAEYGLGLEAFAGLYVAALPVAEGAVKVFLLAGDGPDAAREAFEAYAVNLGRTGEAVELPWPEGTPERRAAIQVALLETVEAGFQAGRWVAGVTEAESAEAAAEGLTRMADLLAAAR